MAIPLEAQIISLEVMAVYIYPCTRNQHRQTLLLQSMLCCDGSAVSGRLYHLRIYDVLRWKYTVSGGLSLLKGAHALSHVK